MFLGGGVPIFLVSRSNTTSPHPQSPSLGTSGLKGSLTWSSLNSLQMRRLRLASKTTFPAPGPLVTSPFRSSVPRPWLRVWSKATHACEYYRLCRSRLPSVSSAQPSRHRVLCRPHLLPLPRQALLRACSVALCPLGLGRALLFRAAAQPGIPSWSRLSWGFPPSHSISRLPLVLAAE